TIKNRHITSQLEADDDDVYYEDDYYYDCHDICTDVRAGGACPCRCCHRRRKQLKRPR
ncbi:hypothetical protein RDWZM_008306, partial [Blomia tropicalis]